MELTGKFRGKVVDNNDPLKRGRIRPLVPAVSEHPLAWAEPCFQYIGDQQDQYLLPPVGANVWIEFERGDVDYPVWVGIFFSPR